MTAMTTVIIEDNTPQAVQFVEYVRTLPFAKIVEAEKEPRKKSLQEAAAECGAISVEGFVGELRARIEQWPDDNA
jgi:hypothetical protein